MTIYRRERPVEESVAVKLIKVMRSIFFPSPDLFFFFADANATRLSGLNKKKKDGVIVSKLGAFSEAKLYNYYEIGSVVVFLVYSFSNCEEGCRR